MVPAAKAASEGTAPLMPADRSSDVRRKRRRRKLIDPVVIGRKGGKARAKVLSKERRIEIAKLGAMVRWGENPKKAKKEVDE